MTRHDRKDLLARLGGRPLVVSLSGGKDSVATCLYLQELELPHERVFQDTHWEADTEVVSHMRYLREYLPEKLGPITEITASAWPGGFKQLVLTKGMFPSKKFRFCSDELKMKAMQEYLATRTDDPVNVVGIRWDESEKRRATWREWSYSEGLDCEVWAPILSWSFEDVAAIMRRHGVRPSPLYLLGAERVGCYPCCAQGGRDELRVLSRDQGRIAEIRALEAEVGKVALARLKPEERRRYPLPTMFQAATRRPMLDEHGQPVLDEKGAPVVWRPCVPIDEAVKWARTVRGGKQFDLLVDVGDGEDIGCARWGFCDAGPARGPKR